MVQEAPAGWEWVACPLCGATESELVFETRNLLFGADVRASLRRCRCGLGMTNPQPVGEELGKYYQAQEYYTHDGGRSLKARARAVAQRWQLRGPAARARLHLERATDLRRFTSRFVPDDFGLEKGLRLLDYGCGSGDVGELCKGLGLEVIGVEPDPKARAAAEARGIRVVGSLGELGALAQSFDRIVLRHVLEHVRDPIGTLRDLGSRLSSTGRILVAVPNVDAHQAKVFGDGWIGYDMPRHLWHFSAATLGAAAAGAGLRVVRMSSVELSGFAAASLANVEPQRRGELSAQHWSARAVEASGGGAELVAVLGAGDGHATTPIVAGGGS